MGIKGKKMTRFRLFCASLMVFIVACGESNSNDTGTTSPDMSVGSVDAESAVDAASSGSSDASVGGDSQTSPVDAEAPLIGDAQVLVDGAVPQSDATVATPDAAMPDAAVADAGALEDGSLTTDSAVCTPSGAEVCNGADDDCDGDVDEDLMVVGTLCDVAGESGPCTQGSQQCVDGILSCIRFYEPTAEVCNGIDDNCDGTIDNGISQIGEACSTSFSGPCSIGTYQCESDANGNVAMTCLPDVAPDSQVEVCNGSDDDCDGAADEGFNVNLSCMGSTPACTYQGVQACNADGEVICEPLPDSDCAELCNGVDDNLNGLVDENIPSNQPCEVGVGACVQQGTLRCVDPATPTARMECDAIAGLGSREICNGITDDCDEAIDEDVLEVGQPCDTGSGNACGPGTYDCQPGGLVCIPNLQQGDQEEIFNCIDDDCDGVVDEDAPGVGGACTVGGGIGACDNGTRQCVEGAITCVANLPTPELCNGLDDDCDGALDNDPLDANQNCNVGLAEDREGSNLCNIGLTRCMTGTLTCETNYVPRCEVENSSADEDCDGVTDESRDRFCGEAEIALEKNCLGLAPYVVPNDDGIHLGARHIVGPDGSVHFARASNAGEMVYTRIGASNLESRHTVIGAAVSGTRAADIVLDGDVPTVTFTLPRPYGPIVAVADRPKPTSLDHWSYQQVDANSWVSNDVALIKFAGTLRLFYRRITDTACEQNRRNEGSQASVYACDSSLVMAEQQNNGNWTTTVLNANGASGVGVVAAQTIDGKLFVAHADALNGNLKVEYFSGGQWRRYAEPSAPAVLNRPADAGTSGLRASIAICGDEVVITHAPQIGSELDNLADVGVVYATRYEIATDTWVSESLSFLPSYSGGGHAIANLDGRAWVFSRERARTSGSIQIELDTLSLSRMTEPRFVHQLEIHRFGDTRHLFNNLQLSSDPFGLPFASFSDQPTGSGSACLNFGGFSGCARAGEICNQGSNTCYAPERVCFYRPLDSDRDRVPDYEENARGTNPDLADTDGDGRSDGDEILIDGTDPLQ